MFPLGEEPTPEQPKKEEDESMEALREQISELCEI